MSNAQYRGFDVSDEPKSKFNDAFNNYFTSGKVMQPTPMLHSTTLSSARLEMFFNETRLAIGTGFFWRIPGAIALVTAWHNFSGLHHTKRNCLSKNGGLPNRVVVRHMSTNPMKFLEQNIPLFIDDDPAQPRWFVHGVCGNYFDIAYVMFAETPEVGFSCINDNLKIHSGYLHPGSQLTVVGFPQGINSIGVFPIWSAG